MRAMWWTAGLIAAVAAAPAAAADCAALTKASLTGAEVTGAVLVPAGAPPFSQKVEFCRVTVTARPSADSDVRLELWIPAGAAWNGKFLQVGNGGFAGKINYRLMALGLAGGYATAGTDDGHQSEDSRDGRWALGHPEKIVDFGTRAVKATTDVAKALLAAYGGGKPKRSYFFGCSDGGREALMTAQRYPDDFDGIVAGAPAYDWTALMATAGLAGKLLQEPGRDLSPAKLPALQAAALKACGNGKGWIDDPQACRFDPGVLACAGAVTDACLTPGELATVRMAYAGQRNPANGRHLPGLYPGAEGLPENSWRNWGVGGGSGSETSGFGHDYFAYFVRQSADFRMSQLTDADLAKSEAKLAPLLNATDSNLKPFRAHGGKLIQYHGWNDPAISPRYSLAYAAAVKARLGKTDDFYRLYMVPGMLHCVGGASPTQVDWLGALDAWVDKGSAPGTIVAHGQDGAAQSLIPATVPAGGKAKSR